MRDDHFGVTPGTRRDDTPPARVRPCLTCGRAPRPQARFCDACGAPLDAHLTATTPADSGPVRLVPPLAPRYSPLPEPPASYTRYTRRARVAGSPSAFGLGFGLSLGWMAARLVIQLVLVAVLLVVLLAVWRTIGL